MVLLATADTDANADVAAHAVFADGFFGHAALQELVLDVEFTLAVLPPTLRHKVLHDDW